MFKLIVKALKQEKQLNKNMVKCDRKKVQLPEGLNTLEVIPAKGWWG
ncbi:hypothetical protein [Shewanella sp. GXUN23E]